MEVPPALSRKGPSNSKWQSSSAIEMISRFLQSNAREPISRSCDGKTIVESDEQPSNAQPPIDKRLEGNANETDLRDWHPLKQLGRSCSTEDGMQIDVNDGQEMNAKASMRKR
jgi:hypothetical protein